MTITTAIEDVALLRPAEAAALLGVSIRQLDRLVDAGVLRPIRLIEGGNRRFRLRDVQAVVNRNEEA